MLATSAMPSSRINEAASELEQVNQAVTDVPAAAVQPERLTRGGRVDDAFLPDMGRSVEALNSGVAVYGQLARQRLVRSAPHPVPAAGPGRLRRSRAGSGR
jgi:hypothetical protein